MFEGWGRGCWLPLGGRGCRACKNPTLVLRVGPVRVGAGSVVAVFEVFDEPCFADDHVVHVFGEDVVA